MDRWGDTLLMTSGFSALIAAGMAIAGGLQIWYVGYAAALLVGGLVLKGLSRSRELASKEET